MPVVYFSAHDTDKKHGFAGFGSATLATPAAYWNHSGSTIDVLFSDGNFCTASLATPFADLLNKQSGVQGNGSHGKPFCIHVVPAAPVSVAATDAAAPAWGIEEGAVLPLKELLRDGRLHTVGTLVVITKSGLALAACHSATRGDGQVYPDSLRVSSSPGDDRRLRHLASNHGLDISALQLYRCTEGGEEGAGCSDASTGASAGRGVSWPHVQPSAHGLAGDEQLHVFGFPIVAERDKLLPEGVPLCVHGVFSNFDELGTIGVGDYLSFPNMSGGAVMRNKQLVGIHVCALTDEGELEQEVDSSKEPCKPSDIHKDDIVRRGLPPDPDPDSGALASKEPLTPDLEVLQRVQKLETSSSSKATPAAGLFVPWPIICAFLVEAGVVDAGSWMQAIAQGQAHKAHKARGSGQRSPQAELHAVGKKTKP